MSDTVKQDIQVSLQVRGNKHKQTNNKNIQIQNIVHVAKVFILYSGSNLSRTVSRLCLSLCKVKWHPIKYEWQAYWTFQKWNVKHLMLRYLHYFTNLS